MRLLVLSFYFKPDLCAGSFRSSAVVRALEERGEADLEIDVLTTSPNRYHSFRTDSPAEERTGRVHIRRIALPNHRSGLLDQSFAFAAFAKGVFRATHGVHYDMVFATSSRLMTAVLGAAIAKRTQARLYLDIRDIFTETLEDIFAGSPKRIVLPPIYALEQYAVRAASQINLVSAGFLDHFRQIRGDLEFRLYTNGIDDVFLGQDFQKVRGDAGPRSILYAGNIGEGQGLDRVVPEAAERLGHGYRFIVIGDGGMRRQLESRVVERTLNNVLVIPPVSRDKLIEYYREADILFMHLNDLPAFRKVLPSKLFELAATGKPILAGVAGYACDFICSEIENAEVFHPCDVDGLVSALRSLKHTYTPRHNFIEKFTRSGITARLADDIIAAAGC